MSRPALAGTILVFIILAVIIYMSFSLTRNRVRVEVCMRYQGRTSCRTSSADTREHARRSAITNACADIASGVTDTMACEASQPITVTWK